jgi:hypothetical protein
MKRLFNLDVFTEIPNDDAERFYDTLTTDENLDELNALIEKFIEEKTGRKVEITAHVIMGGPESDHIGSDFDDFLQEQGILRDVEKTAKDRAKTLRLAADRMAEHYKRDRDLTAFSGLGLDDFSEDK